MRFLNLVLHLTFNLNWSHDSHMTVRRSIFFIFFMLLSIFIKTNKMYNCTIILWCCYGVGVVIEYFSLCTTLALFDAGRAPEITATH